MIKNKSLIKNKRTIKQRKYKRTIKKRKHKRTIKQRKYKRYGGNLNYTPAQRTAVIEECKERIIQVQEAITSRVNTLDVIVDFYTFILDNADILIGMEALRPIIQKKIKEIENKEEIWLDPIHRNENNENLNKLIPTYKNRKERLKELIKEYDQKVLS